MSRFSCGPGEMWSPGCNRRAGPCDRPTFERVSERGRRSVSKEPENADVTGLSMHSCVLPPERRAGSSKGSRGSYPFGRPVFARLAGTQRNGGFVQRLYLRQCPGWARGEASKCSSQGDRSSSAR